MDRFRTLEDLKKYNYYEDNLQYKTKEELIYLIWENRLDKHNYEDRVQLFMELCTCNMSNTNYTLEVIRELVKCKKEYDLSEFCYNVLDKDYNGDNRLFEDVLRDLKKHADKYKY